MDRTMLVLFIMAAVFLVFVGIICGNIVAIRDQIDTIHKIDLELMREFHDSNCTMDQGWKRAIEGWNKTLASWENTVDLNSELLELLNRSNERRE